MSQYINPALKLFQHMDRLHDIQHGGRPAPVNVEIDLSNRCSLGCEWCLTRTAVLDILGRGKCSIADVRPGDRVLAYDENAGIARWAEVYQAAKRDVTEMIYRIVVGDNVIEATGNHEVFTRRGWLEARHLTLTDEVAHVSEAMRMRLRSSREVEGVAVLSRAWADSRNAPRQQRAHEGQQSDETSRGIQEATGDLAHEWRRQGGIGANEGDARRRDVDAAAYPTGGTRPRIYQNETPESHEACQCGCQSQGDTCRCGNKQEDRRTPAAQVARPGIQGIACGTHEAGQSYAPHGSTGKEPARATAAHCCNQDGEVVRGVGESAQFADLVLRPERVLGEGTQPGLQGSQAQVGDRDNGRLHLSQAGANTRQLLHADDSALRSEWARLLSSDDARASLQVARSVAERFGDDCLGFPGDWQERDLGFQRIASITPLEMAVEVFNLETSTATYFANNLLVHNCHFAYTHTRGPLAGKRSKPSGAVGGGDLMDRLLAARILCELTAAGVESVTWTGGGEPTLHPDFSDAVLDAAKLGLQQGLYTHGGHIDDDRATLLKGFATWVFVSLDECTPATYKASKGVDRFDAAVGGIRRLVAAAGNATIGVGFLLHQGNADQVHEMVRFGRSLGVDYVQFRPTVLFEQDAPGELIEGDTAWLRRAMGMLNAYKRDSFVIADRERFEMYASWRGHPFKTCNWSAIQTVITPNGKVWRCTNKREHPEALLGDLSVESFDAIWQRNGGPCQVDAACRIMCRGVTANITLEAIMQPMAHGSFI